MGLYSYSTRQRAGSTAIPSIDELRRDLGRTGGGFTVVPFVEPARTDDLSQMQIIALLRMASSTICNGIAVRMQIDVEARPMMPDYRRLVCRGLAVPPTYSHRRHRITVQGESMARHIARIEARARGIHVMVEGGHVGAQATYRCTCGKWSGTWQRGTYTNANAHGAFARHLAKVEAQRRGEAG